ncbi:tRNA epoxyqueuosine(34) reductase QueG [bacterium]|nr:tRNA epoxyqueuosine(34) reductase QueG [bacterium]
MSAPGKDELRTKALELGFDDCRFTTAAPPENAPHFKKWISDNHHGEMGYIERNGFKRIDPQQVLNNARSIITLAVSYHQDSAEKYQDQTQGLFARYSRYSDYHDVIAKPLKELSMWLDERAEPEHRSLWYTDTGPILEREMAQRAGLGFQGKHTNLISRKLGNWFFLSEILTQVEFPPDKSEKNHCGKCTSCITACPTQAIRAPFQLDARRCISYLTIELKGSIPVEYRRAIGKRIYGCDDCLAACPWNRFAQQASLMHEAHHPEFDQPDLIDLLSLDDEGFRKRFRGTPMKRTKRRGILRNVCIALGNTGNKDALPALETASRDSEPLIVEHALWAIDEINQRHHD